MPTRPLRILNTPDAVMDATIGAMTTGLVPVMGPVHAGHLALINRAYAENDDTIVALVHPSGALPTVSDADGDLLSEAGASILYLPSPEIMPGPHTATTIHVRGVTNHLHTSNVPDRADRVTTLIATLLNQLRPTRTYIGEKHFGQLVMLQRAHDDLALPGTIVPCATVRDPDGLPLSSYNNRLSEDERAAAIAIPAALFAIQAAVRDGENNPDHLLESARTILAAHPTIDVKALAIVDPFTLHPVETVHTGDRAIVVVSVGDTRIHDNVYLETDQGIATA